MGVGDPASLVEAVALGVDQFDCVLQTRLGRHGTALTGTGKLHVKAARHAAEDEPLDRDVPLRGVRPAQPRLPAPPVPGRRADRRPGCVSLHNMAWTLAADGPRCGRRSPPARFDALRAEVLAVWG